VEIVREFDNRTTRVNSQGLTNEIEGLGQNEIQVNQRLGDTYRNDYMESIRIPKGRSVGEVVTICNVRDISEEWQMARNKSLQFTFYDSHQFGTSRGFLRNAVS